MEGIERGDEKPSKTALQKLLPCPARSTPSSFFFVNETDEQDRVPTNIKLQLTAVFLRAGRPLGAPCPSKMAC